MFAMMRILILCLISPAFFPTHTSGQSKQVKNPFFSFNTGIKSGGFSTDESRAELLKDLQFDGVEQSGVDGFKDFQKAFKKKGLNIYTIYLKIDLDNPDQPYDPGVLDIFKMIKGKNTMPWFHIVSKKYPPSSSENDEVAINILRELAAKAAKYKVKIMLYPHLNTWLETHEDAIRVCEKLGMDNVGMTFNLCHFLAYTNREGIDNAKVLPDLASKSMPYLFAISLNGADAKPTNPNQIWNSFIQPLGKGKYDTYGYLKTFLDLGFKGPVGLQTYSINQNSKKHLSYSISTWKSYMSRYNEGL